VDQFKLVSITSGESELVLSQNQLAIVTLIGGKKANQILENLAILDFNGGEDTKVKSSLQKFLFQQVYGTSCKSQH
jgi:hypothetical protein